MVTEMLSSFLSGMFYISIIRDSNLCFSSTKNLILSGGDGYIDFRVDEEDPSVSGLSKGDRSHLIVWEVMSPATADAAVVSVTSSS